MSSPVECSSRPQKKAGIGHFSAAAFSTTGVFPSADLIGNHPDAVVASASDYASDDVPMGPAHPFASRKKSE
ncbi:hypothetical protein MUK42_33693 [Musa troglodytarum]|uniref:Uncharacterized protein n=1 Tax=Musa troglodytarum TaxID=320322 RepID=A0A9E7E9N6_9LILI|nr:hypothetical protein MUK42_33693 [Musa troglodytarum]